MERVGKGRRKGLYSLSLMFTLLQVKIVWLRKTWVPEALGVFIYVLVTAFSLARERAVSNMPSD